jgi:hypothetical protein
MIERGLMTGESGKSSVLIRVRGQRMRAYRITPKILE